MYTRVPVLLLYVHDIHTRARARSHTRIRTRTHTHIHIHARTIKHLRTKMQWHALGREEQAKYYELARRERQLHQAMYPDWSSRTNASRGKKRKRKQDSNDGGS